MRARSESASPTGGLAVSEEEAGPAGGLEEGGDASASATPLERTKREAAKEMAVRSRMDPNEALDVPPSENSFRYPKTKNTLKKTGSDPRDSIAAPALPSTASAKSSIDIVVRLRYSTYHAQDRPSECIAPSAAMHSNGARPPFVAIFDIETQDKISDMPGRFRDDKIARLQVSCASIICVDSELVLDPDDAERAIELATMHTFWRDGDQRNGMAAMIELLDRAEMIVGYNLFGFDYTVVKKYYRSRAVFDAHRAKTHDIFSSLRDATGTWFKLDRLLELNGLGMKTADGLEAIAMWATGRREELREYCEGDVRQCARLGMLRSLDVDGVDGVRLPNYCFGIASALTALRFSSGLGEVLAEDEDRQRRSEDTGATTASEPPSDA